jgi:phage/plasmid-like protein (TIGR03299 family)
MSRETIQWLNTQTLIGNTDHRGHAWHYRAEEQGDETNHYPGPIPVEDVSRRLFDWQAVSRRVAVEVPATVETMTHLNAAGEPMRWVVQDHKQAITRDDNHHVMGIFAEGYEMHQYEEWLLTQVANLLDDDLGISSAGLLKQGAIAWVEVSVPESITTPEGVQFRPNLLATTSFDGSIATTYKRTVTDTVCDNTREQALSESGQTYKVKHSRYSKVKLLEAREALAVVHSLADDFAREVAQLCKMKVSPKQWQTFIDTYASRNNAKTGKQLTGRSLTMVDKKRAALQRLYQHDERVAPWAGTAWGVMAAVNTWEHHEKTVRGSERAERNMLRTVTGDFGKTDRDVLEHLQVVLA